MANEGRGTLTRVYGRLFPERQIYLRTDGEVRFVTFSGKVQLGLASIVLLLGVWFTFSTFQYIFQNDIIAAKNERIRAGQEAYRVLEGEMRDTQLRFINAARDLDAKHSQLIALVSHKENLERRLDEISGRLAAVSDDHREASKEAAALRKQLQGERNALAGQIGTLQGELRSTLKQRSGLEQDLAETRNRVVSLSAERDTLIKSNADLMNNLETVNDRLVDIKDEQQRFIERIAARTTDDIALLEDTIAMTGLKPERLFEKSGVLDEAMGGPVIDPSAGEDGSDDRRRQPGRWRCVRLFGCGPWKTACSAGKHYKACCGFCRSPPRQTIFISRATTVAVATPSPSEWRFTRALILPAPRGSRSSRQPREQWPRLGAMGPMATWSRSTTALGCARATGIWTEFRSKRAKKWASGPRSAAWEAQGGVLERTSITR